VIDWVKMDHSIVRDRDYYPDDRTFNLFDRVTNNYEGQDGFIISIICSAIAVSEAIGFFPTTQRRRRL